MQAIFLSFLGAFARCIILIKKPYIIGVTGTVGKTTITSHIATLLRKEYAEASVRISPYHYNGEFWLPLSIIGAKTGGKNLFLWILVFFRFLIQCVRPYPRYLILEYGIDHPGEMDFLLSIAVPDIGILTPVTPNHLEQFGTFEAYKKEKLLFTKKAKKLISHESHRQYIDREAIYYSMGGMSDIDASHLEISVEGVHAQIHLKKKNYPLFVPAFWAYQVENILPLYGIADMLHIDPEHVNKYSAWYLPEPGRSSILSGLNGSTIIDGSYNGGFESLCRGIDSILPFCARHRIICFLGDMRELGDHTAKVHSDLAQYIQDHVERHHDVQFFLVGPLMQKYVAPLIHESYPTQTSLSSRTLGMSIRDLLTLKDERPTIIYVKGSQNTIFLEEGIKHFLKHKKDESLLCRQSSEWMKKKDEFFKNLPKT